jgi:putative hemolysin
VQEPTATIDAPDAAEAVKGLLSGTPFRVLTPLVGRWFTEHISKLPSGPPEDGAAFFSGLLKNLNIAYEYAATDLARIPASGPVLVVANHPFGAVEGIVLGAVLSKVRRDVLLMANSLVASVPGLRDHIILVNPFGGPKAAQDNRTPLRKCIEWLRSGGVLVVFPAGEVATIRLRPVVVTDGEWNHNAARLSHLTGAAVLPVFFHGANGPAFHAAGFIHPSLRTVLLPCEFFNKAGKVIRLSIGTAISADRLAAACDPTAYVRGRTLLMEGRAWKPKVPAFLSPRQKTIAKPQEPAALTAEIGSLPQDRVLLRHGEYVVCVAVASQIPRGLEEIGRLREIAFRQAGEGSGKTADLDRFDDTYEHLLLWNDQTREIVGGYRLARTDEVIASAGVRGLYTSTLFRLTAAFYRGIQPALELGRSFVRPEYQKGFLPLLLLWKGIGHYVGRNLRYRFLFGPVSISADYTSPSRALIVAFLTERRPNGLAAHIKPRTPFRAPRLGHCDPRNFSSLLSDLDELSEVVADIEPDHRGLPVLLRHYLNLGGRILEFNVDRSFSNALDGLFVLDLVGLSRRQLERYMGRANAEIFLREHGAT